jgi:ParB-like chromosome segregation protein Spo0J
MLATHRAARKLAKGHTPARVAAALCRIESRMRRGHDDLEAIRPITDPLFGMDVETVERLAPIVADPDVPPDRKLAAIEARRREVEAMPEIDALYGLRVTLVAQALTQIWPWYAVDSEDTVRQWQFVLAILEAAGEGTEGVRQHPERLKRDVGRLLQLTAQPAGSA